MKESSALYESVDQAFSKQAIHFDENDRANRILLDLREQVYRHVERLLKPGSKILELNAGTGIDAVYLANAGHRVHATDLSHGMVAELERKCLGSKGRITCQQLSFDNLSALQPATFDFVFSNSGGLNCIDDLSKVTRQLPSILRPSAYVTFVIMPRVCPVEMLSIFRGNLKTAFRRFQPGGTMAHVEGSYFPTYYHSLSSIKKAFGKNFQFVRSEGLAAVSPQPHSTRLVSRFPGIYKSSRKIDKLVRNFYPFDRWADHIIVTFRFKG